jgi:hypothetical protein
MWRRTFSTVGRSCSAAIVKRIFELATLQLPQRESDQEYWCTGYWELTLECRGGGGLPKLASSYLNIAMHPCRRLCRISRCIILCQTKLCVSNPSVHHSYPTNLLLCHQARPYTHNRVYRYHSNRSIEDSPQARSHNSQFARGFLCTQDGDN